MRRGASSSKSRSVASNPPGNEQERPDSSSGAARAELQLEVPRRSSYVMLTLLFLLTYGSWSVYHYQYHNLPVPLTAEQAGKRGFSEVEAMKHVHALAGLGSHSVGSDALDRAVQYVMMAAEAIKNASHWEVDVEVEHFHVKTGANRLDRGLFAGKTLIYADLSHVIMRFSPRYAPEARENAILVSSHIDTVFSTGGAGDCSSCVAVMLELARGISQWAHSFKNSIIVLFNTGEEEGLSGAHGFMTQHPWSDTIQMAVDLEAMGVGGKSGIFQSGPDPLAIESFAMVAKHPSGQIMAQDLFTSGVIKSATDFQVYKEVGGISGLDFAYTDKTAVYHTKNDKVELLKAGSLQHLGENMLPFLRQIASSSDLGKSKAFSGEENAEHDSAIYFDILGTYMIVFRKKFGKMLNSSIIMQSLLIWSMSLYMGGFPAAVSLVLSCLSVILMWLFSLGSSVLVAFMLSYVSSSAVPYIRHPWLAIGLFGSPSLLGALAGQHIGFRILQMYLSSVYSKGKQNMPPSVQATLAKLEAERWLYKSGIIQWLIVLIVSDHYSIGSSYIALIWLVSTAFSYGLLEATLSPARLPKPLKIVTLLVGFSVPVLVSAGPIIRIVGVLIGTIIRLDSNPGGISEWLANVVVSAVVAVVVCLMLVYLLSYFHLSGAKRLIIGAACVLFGLSLAAVSSGIIPPFDEDIARAVQVVHVVDTTGVHGKNQDPVSYISLSSLTPGKLTKEMEHIEEGLVCGRNRTVDFVTFSVNYGCWTYDGTESGWSEQDLPRFQVERDLKTDKRVSQVSLDTKLSTRWALTINTHEIDDFEFKGDSEVLVPLGKKSSKDGWHLIQFAGGKKSPTKFTLTLHWASNSSSPSGKDDAPGKNKRPLLKLRTDVDRLTPKAKKVLMKLPNWCSLFGKSTSPYNLAFLASLPVQF